MQTTEITTDNHHKSCADRISEWVQGSGVSPELTEKWLEQESDPSAIARLLNWKNYEHTPGWYVRSCNPITGKRGKSGQFKPDFPFLLPETDKEQKYFSFPKGKGSEAIYAVMTLNEWIKISEAVGVAIDDEDIDETRDDLGFWQWVKNHPEIPLVITEGAKKAGCLLSHGYISIALTGVWNGQQQKGKKLHPSLEPFIVPGRPVYLAFDADVVVKENVEAALRQLGRLCKAKKAEVFIVSWALELGKGCDDLIVNQGIEAFSAAIDDSMSYGEWLKNLEKQLESVEGSNGNSSANGSKSTQKVPPADVLAREIAESYRSQLCFSNESKQWMRYEADEPGCWSPETDEFIESIVSEIIDGKGISGYGSNAYVVNVKKKIRHEELRI